MRTVKVRAECGCVFRPSDLHLLALCAKAQQIEEYPLRFEAHIMHAFGYYWPDSSPFDAQIDGGGFDFDAPDGFISINVGGPHEP